MIMLLDRDAAALPGLRWAFYNVSELAQHIEHQLELDHTLRIQEPPRLAVRTTQRVWVLLEFIAHLERG